MFDFVEKSAIIYMITGGNLFLKIYMKGLINMSEASIRKFIKEQRKKTRRKKKEKK